MDERLYNYIEQHIDKEPTLLKELSRETHIKIYNPRMLAGHFQGRLLAMISKMIKPKYVLEIGTYTGYSTLCLAEGIQEKGEIHTIEKNDELVDFIRSYINKSQFAEKIVLHIGDAREIVPKINLLFDLVFIDGNKKEYVEYYNVIINKVKKGGFIIADNVLWNGKVIDKIENDENTKAVREFNKIIAENDELEKILLPIRDGIFIIRKK